MPHRLGISIGFVFLAIVVGVGLATVFERYPATHTVLKVFSVVYLLWLAWKIANAAAPDTAPREAGGASGHAQSGQAASARAAAERAAPGRPFTFLRAATFQ